MSASLTIGIPSFQRCDHLAALLASIDDSLRDLAADLAATSIDVVVVLDGSTDGSNEMVERLATDFPVSLRSVWQPNAGLASARNVAVDSSTHDVVWLIDDDMTVTPESIARHMEHERDEAPILMGPSVVLEESGLDEMQEFYDARHAGLATRGYVESAEECSFANTSAPRSLLVDQPFDQRYRGYGMEDFDLAARLLGTGVCIAFDARAAIVHRATPTRPERLTKLREEGANRVRFVALHPEGEGVAFPRHPARFERLVRRIARPELAPVLWRVGALIERASCAPPMRHQRRRLQYWADTCAVYSGVAAETGAQSHLISVVIPAFNASATIVEALGFLRSQTSSAWEAVVVDDGSTDSTAEIVAKIASRDSRVRLLRQPNGGVGAARNAGRVAASAPWLLFLDSDDRIDPSFVERMQGAMSEHPGVNGVRCNWGYETDDGRIETVVNHQLDGGADLFTAAAERSPFAIHSCVVSAEAVERVGGFDERLRVGEDWDLWQRLGRAGARLVTVPETLSFYRLRADSAMRFADASATSDSLTVYRRTHSEDSRVAQQVPEYRSGAPVDATRDVVAERVAWAVGMAVASGERAAELLVGHVPPLESWLDPQVVAGTLYEAVPFACCALASDWPQLWPDREDAIRGALRDYEEWAGHGNLADRVIRTLEVMVAGAEQGRVGSAFGMRVDMEGEIANFPIPSGVDRLVVSVTDGQGIKLGTADLPVLEDVLNHSDLRDAIQRQLAPTLTRRALSHATTAVPQLRSLIDRRRLRMLARLVADVSLDDRGSARDFARRWARAAVRPPSELGVPPTGPEADDAAVLDGEPDLEGGKETRYFEDIYAVEDPWSYTSPYEQQKYEQTLELIEDLDPANVLELACAEGHFTVQLAPRVDRLVAADISPTAIARATERCAGLDNVELRVIDLRADALPEGHDLVICSEVLYYLDSEVELAEFAERVAGALVPGGHLVTAHQALTRDDPSAPGFTWERPFGAKRIGEVMAANERLALVSEVVTPLYRIQLFRRIEPATPVGPAIVHERTHGPLDLRLHRSVAWDGVTVMPTDVWESEITNRLPVLMYHRVAESGVAALDRYRIDPELFESQLDHLRRQGYYGVTAERWRFAMEQHRSLPGRAVMLTFDDGYRDFLEQAYPLLDAYGFSATVFLVPQLVGGEASWDAQHGDVAPLLSWEEIAWLGDQGIEFASHTGAHVALDGMSARDALQQELGARKDLEDHLGAPVDVLSYPFGVHDASIRETMRAAGYRIGFTSESGLASVWDDPLRLPRIEVRGDRDLAAFVAALPSPTRRNPLHGTLGRIRRIVPSSVSRRA